MKLNYATPPLSEGGSAVPGCGTIHLSEVTPTLTQLSDDLELPFNLSDYTIGSTGKSEYSGDLDVVIEDKWWGHGITAFRENLVELFGPHDVARNGSMLHIKYPIVGFNAKLDERKPRTGFVQVDFNFGNYEWEKFYHYSSGSESAYKGAHRNLAIGSLCATVDTYVMRSELDSFDRPISVTRWKYGPKGFCRILRQSTKSNGKWIKKQTDIAIGQPAFYPDVIAKTLLPLDGVPDDLNSLESIMDAVCRNYDLEQRERIWERMANNFYDWPDGRNFNYPSEISKYLPPK